MAMRWLGRYSAARSVMLVTVLAAGCASVAPPPLVAPPLTGLALDEAVIRLTDHLFQQAQRDAVLISKFRDKDHRAKLLIDPLIDPNSGEQTKVMQKIREKIAARIRSTQTRWDIFEPNAASVAPLQYLLAATLERERTTEKKLPFRIAASLVDSETGIIVAHSIALVLDEGIDTTPIQFSQDSPVLVRDRVSAAHAQTAAAAAGQTADPRYVNQIAAAALIAAATDAYNNRRFEDALQQFGEAARFSGGAQLRVYSGIYLSSMHLGRQEEAERAFGKIATLGIANRSLDVKFLFRPGSTDFWPDPKVSGFYPMWVRQIARQAIASKVCLSLIGHTSHTGSEKFNDGLSMRRATTIKERLEAESPDLANRTQATGVGWRENLVGSGTDDARDAPDRRVGFKVIGC